jgi:hypothetical protein
MPRAAFSIVLGAVVVLEGVAHAQDTGCKPMPIFTPARDDVSELRCFPAPPRPIARVGARDSTSPLSIVLAGVGTAGLGAFIGFGIGGNSQLVNGVAPRSAEGSIRVDYAIANVGLAVGITALVTSIVLIVTHH